MDNFWGIYDVHRADFSVRYSGYSTCVNFRAHKTIFNHKKKWIFLEEEDKKQNCQEPIKVTGALGWCEILGTRTGTCEVYLEHQTYRARE